MSQIDTSIKQQNYDVGVTRVDMKLEVEIVPVSDVDRAKEFYQKLGWRLDKDHVEGNDFRVVQLTPPGSGCSITFGKGVTAAVPGLLRGGLIVSDIKAAHKELVARASTRARCFTARRSPPRDASAARTPSARATAHTSPSKIPTATCGSSRRSRVGCPVASISRRRPLRQQTIWQAPSGARQPPTTSSRSATLSRTRTGQTGTQRSCRRSRQGPSCRCERVSACK
jgi:catechol 2,3-dioxygenase-like lactoylglutathione lyase family enzyme